MINPSPSDAMSAPLNLAVIILTYNEEDNIGQALDSVVGWAKQVFVFDSHSQDKTLQICERYPCTVIQHEFENFGAQRNAALEQLPIRTEWVLFLDADEWIPRPLKREIEEVIASNPTQNGFYLNRRFIWLGRWIRRGYYPTWLLRLFRLGRARCEERGVNEHIVVQGEVGRLGNDLVHEDRKDISRWVARHNEFATREARELFLRGSRDKQVQARLNGSQEQRKRWIRDRIWNHLPPLTRPFLYFGYRYFISLGFLDGKEALMYHLLQGFWYPLLIDVRYLEMKRGAVQDDRRS